MKDPFLNHIESLIEQILTSQNYSQLSQKDKIKLSQNFKEHFQNLVLETFVNRLNDQELKEVQNIAKKPNLLAEKFEQYAALIPGLATDIEDRLLRETEALKSL